MKIKSWTGDEVDARVGMVVRFPDGSIGVIEKIKEKYIQVAHIGCPTSTLTMLHCPFQVGDAVHDYLAVSEQYSRESFVITRQEFADRANCGKLNVIHANPSLRTSEEYENEKRDT